LLRPTLPSVFPSFRLSVFPALRHSGIAASRHCPAGLRRAKVQARRHPADPCSMGARLGFADVLLSKLADVPPPVALGWREPSIVSPSWVHRLEPLRVVSAQVLQARYPHTATAAPAGPARVEETASQPSRGGSSAIPSPARPRTERERLGIALLNRLGASLDEAATDEQIRSAYRRLVRESHPDRHQASDPASLEARARTLRAVIRAWDVYSGRVADAA
jgi:hypothetical protein